MNAIQTVTDEQVRLAYWQGGSIYAASRALGLSPQTVHKRLVHLGVRCEGNGKPWSESDNETLRHEYLIHRDAGKLESLAERMGRTKYFICRQARVLGLTDAKHGKSWFGVWKYMTAEVADGLFAKFKASPLTMGRFCARHGYGESGFAATMRRFFPDAWEHVIESKVPKTTKYRIGRQFEYRTRDDLKTRGYFVMRAPASRSPMDLLAVKKGAVLFVQCKTGGALGVAEWNELFDLAASVGAVPVAASREDGRALTYRRLAARKTGKKAAQPWEPFDPGIRVHSEQPLLISDSPINAA